MTDTSPEINNILKSLEQKEQVESLAYLVEKLPDLVDKMKIVEDKADFLVSSLTDQQSLSVLAEETENKIKDLQIDETHFDAILKMTHMLPRLVPMMEQMDNIAAFVEDVASDEKTIAMLIDGVNDIVPIKEGTEILEETNSHFKANNNQSDISVFGLMKMLKDPVVQDGLKYTKSLLHVINKHR